MARAGRGAISLVLLFLTLSPPEAFGVASQEPWASPVRKALTRKSVAIVGGGSAGLASLKTILDIPGARERWNVVLFEERRDVGGIWLPDPNDPRPPELPETPLYPALRTNTPTPSMTFPRFPFRELTPIFSSHEYVEQYHKDYAEHFKLNPFIRLNTSVLSTAWVGSSNAGAWNVTIRDGNGDERTNLTFDNLVVASGHNHYPHVPTWTGQDIWLRTPSPSGFKREILHSMFWRNATKYAGQSVLVVGGGASGRDAVLLTAPTARKIYLSLKEEKTPPGRIPTNFIRKPEIAFFTPDAVVFNDGSFESDIDSIILGTGYDLHIPYLTAGGALSINPDAHTCPDNVTSLTSNLRYLFPLHEHIFSLATAYPPTALSFVGLPMLVANCPSDVAQALLVAHAINNPSILDSRDEMREQLRAKERHMRERSLDPYYVGHRLIDIDVDEDGRKPDMAHDYQDALYEFLKVRGAIPDDGEPFVESWRRSVRNESEFLWRGWARVEALGEDAVLQWLKGVRTEEQWVDLMSRLAEWEKEQEQ